MKNGFKDPLAVKEGKKMKSPWNFDAPAYDQRSSCYVSAGADYGVGHRQPVGHKNSPKSAGEALPMGKVKTGGSDKDAYNKVQIETAS